MKIKIGKPIKAPIVWDGDYGKYNARRDLFLDNDIVIYFDLDVSVHCKTIPGHYYSPPEFDCKDEISVEVVEVWQNDELINLAPEDLTELETDLIEAVKWD